MSNGQKSFLRLNYTDWKNRQTNNHYLLKIIYLPLVHSWQNRPLLTINKKNSVVNSKPHLSKVQSLSQTTPSFKI